MEYLLIHFREDREVTIDGEIAGIANQLITLGPGSVTVSLAAPRNFSPRKIDVTVEDTSPLDPLEVRFE